VAVIEVVVAEKDGRITRFSLNGLGVVGQVAHENYPQDKYAMPIYFDKQEAANRIRNADRVEIELITDLKAFLLDFLRAS